MKTPVTPFGCKTDKRIRSLAWISGVTLVTIAFSLLVAFVWLSLDPVIDVRDIYLSCILIPLVVAPLGTIAGIRKQRLVEALAEENIRLANTDTLTGLPNRRAFMARALELQANTQVDQVFVCLIGDIDDFKLVNDQHGHPVGDDVLESLGRQLASLLTDSSIVARLGGEEFAIAGIFDSLDAARAYGETLVTSVSKRGFVGHGVKMNLTISMGLAADRGGEGVSALLSRADKALYRSKAEGKNRLTEAA